jgi:hypothetical protein
MVMKFTFPQVFHYTIHSPSINTQMKGIMMKRILTALLMIVLLGLSACTVPATEDATPTTPDDQVTDDMQIDVASSPNPGDALIGSIQTFTVTDNDQIIEILADAIKSRKILFNLDMHAIDEPDCDYDSLLFDDFFLVLEQYPDLEYADYIHCCYDTVRQLLFVEIEYIYYLYNKDVFCIPDIPDLYVVLDKKVLKVGETANITLAGKDADLFSIHVFSNPIIIKVKDDHNITALAEGQAHLNILVTGKDFNRCYNRAFYVLTLPQDTPDIDDIAGLVTVAWQGLDRPYQSIFIRNEKLKQNDMKRALEQVGYGFFVCKFGWYFAHISYFGDSEIPIEQRIDQLTMAERKADEIIAEIIRPGMSELEKETAVYDYLIQNTQYDYRVYDDPDNFPYASRTAYGPIINGTGVCAGYAYALQMLLNRAGIECLTVHGTCLDQPHMWNIAKIDNVYYQMDATFDSSYSHNDNRISHDYFNISDTLMGWDHDWYEPSYPPCPDTLSE